MLEVTFVRLTHYMSKWQPPGRGSRGVCHFCTVTYDFLTGSPMIRELPHDIAHFLVWELHIIFNQTYELLIDQEEAERAARDLLDIEILGSRQDRLVHLAAQAEDDVLEALDQHLEDLERARVTFIEPKIEEYVRAVLAKSSW